jgi:hypothetical protein
LYQVNFSDETLPAGRSFVLKFDNNPLDNDSPGNVVLFNGPGFSVTIGETMTFSKDTKQGGIGVLRVDGEVLASEEFVRNAIRNGVDGPAGDLL